MKEEEDNRGEVECKTKIITRLRERVPSCLVGLNCVQRHRAVSCYLRCNFYVRAHDTMLLVGR